MLQTVAYNLSPVSINIAPLLCLVVSGARESYVSNGVWRLPLEAFLATEHQPDLQERVPL